MEIRFSSQSFLFMRHGETEWNAKGVFQGRADIPLNSNGKKQAKCAAQQLTTLNISIIISSPLKRAYSSAEIVADQLGLPLKVEHDLMECDFGSLDGTSISEAMKKFDISKKEQLASILPNDGEQWDQLRVRSLKAIAKYLNSDESVLFVSHDAVLQSIAEQLIGAWFDARHGIPYRFSKNSLGWRVSQIS